ncbi:2'-5' RNA ligase family protein [Streptomyces sp. CB02414]|uniref:2'-5' RNA ligase family protein n=1 Tax=Streptomyces sp. CB02414 TaxID=1703922 RepID=UPI003082DB8E
MTSAFPEQWAAACWSRRGCALSDVTRRRARCPCPAAAYLPLPLRFAGTVRFAGPTSVLAWSLELDSALADLHRRVWEAVASDSPPGTLSPFHSPRDWNPHITLGRTRRAGAFTGRHVPGLLPAPPLSARLTTLRSYDTVTGALEVLEPRL